jgi:hypothetical protein
MLWRRLWSEVSRLEFLRGPRQAPSPYRSVDSCGNLPGVPATYDGTLQELVELKDSALGGEADGRSTRGATLATARPPRTGEDVCSSAAATSPATLRGCMTAADGRGARDALVHRLGELDRDAPAGGRRAGAAGGARASPAAQRGARRPRRPRGEVARRRGDDGVRLGGRRRALCGDDAADGAAAGGGRAAGAAGGAARGRGAAGGARLVRHAGGGGAAAVRPGGGGADPVQRAGGPVARRPAGVPLRGGGPARAEGVGGAGGGVRSALRPGRSRGGAAAHPVHGPRRGAGATRAAARGGPWGPRWGRDAGGRAGDREDADAGGVRRGRARAGGVGAVGAVLRGRGGAAVRAVRGGPRRVRPRGNGGRATRRSRAGSGAAGPRCASVCRTFPSPWPCNPRRNVSGCSMPSHSACSRWQPGRRRCWCWTTSTGRIQAP